MMSNPYIVYGQKGTGSVPVEATLHLLGERYEVAERRPGDDRPAGNPMQQVPVLILPSGELMTESAAILIYLADSHPASRLSPALDDPRRPAFLRWMVYVARRSTRISGRGTSPAGSPLTRLTRPSSWSAPASAWPIAGA
jgi:GST-like protein